MLGTIRFLSPVTLLNPIKPRLMYPPRKNFVFTCVRSIMQHVASTHSFSSYLIVDTGTNIVIKVNWFQSRWYESFKW